MRAIPSLGSLRGRHRSRNARADQSRAGVPPRSTPVVDCAVYINGERRPGQWTHTEAVETVRQQGEGFVWISLYEPDAQEIQDIATTFGLHELAVEDAVHAHQRPKLEHYGNTLFLVFRTIRYVEHKSPTTADDIVELGELMVFLGADFLITVRHGHGSGPPGPSHELDTDPAHLAAGPASMLHAIADQVVDHFLEVTARIEEDIDELEAEVFAPQSQVTSEQIYLMKREVLELQRAVTPLTVLLRTLTEDDLTLVPDEVRSYFRNVHDHATTAAERVAAFDKLLTTLVDATIWKITLQLNSDMRKITAWAAIIAVPTALAGIYGMNFDYMPELHWRYAYPVTIAVILVLCLTLYRVFRRKRWL